MVSNTNPSSVAMASCFRDFHQIAFDRVTDRIERQVVNSSGIEGVLQFHSNPIERQHGQSQ